MGAEQLLDLRNLRGGDEARASRRYVWEFTRSNQTKTNTLFA